MLLPKAIKTDSAEIHNVIVGNISIKHDLSKYYIRQCVNGKKEGITSDKVRSEYKKMAREIQKVESDYMSN